MGKPALRNLKRCGHLPEMMLKKNAHRVFKTMPEAGKKPSQEAG
jgi:hypothetical protein